MSSSPLLDLAGELRNKIWRYALVKPSSIDVAEKTSLDEPALLAVNKQIRGEGLEIYYAENAFRLETRPERSERRLLQCFPLKEDVRWLHLLGNCRAGMIKKFVLGCSDANEASDGSMAWIKQLFLRVCSFDGRQRRAAEVIQAWSETYGLSLTAIEVVVPEAQAPCAEHWLSCKEELAKLAGSHSVA